MQTNRLTVLGQRGEVTKFQRSRWLLQTQGRYYDVLELAPTRYACQFEISADPLPVLQKYSRKQPGLTFLLDYEARRMKGLAMIKAGRITRYEVSY